MCADCRPGLRITTPGPVILQLPLMPLMVQMGFEAVPSPAGGLGGRGGGGGEWCGDWSDDWTILQHVSSLPPYGGR